MDDSKGKDNGPGELEVGLNEKYEVVINLPVDMTGHIVFSPDQARGLAGVLTKKAHEAEVERNSGVVAIAQSELDLWGCPHCGYRSGTAPVHAGNCMSWMCGDCGKSCIVLADGVTQSRIGVGGGLSAVYPTLRDHPRRGMPKHGRPDVPPTGGGEFFRSRGIGMDHCRCFVCGDGPDVMKNIAAFVQCKAAGERVVEMFDGKANLDYREREPDRVQVKIGACNKHFKCLEALDEAMYRQDVLSRFEIETAIRVGRERP